MTTSNDTQPRIPKAVAIKGAGTTHGHGKQPQPKIIAKGSGLLAEKILDIAFAEGVKVRQDKDLTELLDAFDVESPIPLEALHAVSLILERVYAENNKMMDQAADTSTFKTAVDPNAFHTATDPRILDGKTGEPITDSDPNNRDRSSDTRGPA